MSAYENVPITLEQKRKAEETVSMLSMQAPGFLHLLYSMLNHQSVDGEFVMVMSRDVPIAATDAFNIIVNPDTFFLQGLGERTFIMGHEVIHNMYFDVELLEKCTLQNHVLMPDGSKLPFDNGKLQLAMDARINALLIESKIGKKPDIGHFDPHVKGGDSVYDVYRRYMQQPPPGQGGQPQQPKPGQPGQGQNGTQPQPPKPGNGNPNNGFDSLLKPGEATGKSNAKQDKERWAVETQAAEQLEKLAQGNLPAGMQKMFKELLNPEVSWLDLIEVTVKQQVGDGAVDWYTPHPWYGTTDDGDYFYPDETGYGCGWVVVWGDTSGSVFSDGVQARNIAELSGVLQQVRPKRLTLIWCDASIKAEGSVIELTDASDLRDLKPVGGGGTNYFPVLDWIKNNSKGEDVDLGIFFTDGEVQFAKSHPFPTIWASSSPPGKVKYPFGQVIHINNIARSK